MNPAGPKAYSAADMLYGPDEMTGLREEVIILRDQRLKEGDFAAAIILSHTIALLAAVIEDAK